MILKHRTGTVAASSKFILPEKGEDGWRKNGQKRQADDVVCCCRYKGDNAEQCEATMTSGMEGLALHNEREPHFFLFSFFTTLISAFMESEEVSKFQAQFRGTRSGCRECKGFKVLPCQVLKT